MPGIDKEKAERVKKVSSTVNAELRILHKEHELRLKLIPTTPESEKFVSNFLPNFAETMAAQLSTFFNIKGEIIDVGKE